MRLWPMTPRLEQVHEIGSRYSWLISWREPDDWRLRGSRYDARKKAEHKHDAATLRRSAVWQSLLRKSGNSLTRFCRKLDQRQRRRPANAVDHVPRLRRDASVSQYAENEGCARWAGAGRDRRVRDAIKISLSPIFARVYSKAVGAPFPRELR
jgi:hypothetical protein